MPRRRNATHFRKKRLNAEGPVERILCLLVIAAVVGITIGLILPKTSPTVGEITGEYTATGTTAETLERLTVDDNPSKAGYDRTAFGYRQTDADSNGCDVREDVLARDLTDVRYQSAGGCKVQSGTLNDPYTGKTIHFRRGRDTSSAVRSTMWWRLRMRVHAARANGAEPNVTNTATTCTICWRSMVRPIRRRVPRRPPIGCPRTATTVAITSRVRSA